MKKATTKQQNKVRHHYDTMHRRQQMEYMPYSVTNIIFFVFAFMMFVCILDWCSRSSATAQPERQNGSMGWWDRFYSWWWSSSGSSPITTSSAIKSTTTSAPVVGSSISNITALPVGSVVGSTTIAPGPSWTSFFKFYFSRMKAVVGPTSPATTRIPWPNCMPGDRLDTPAPRDRFQVWSQKTCMWVDQAAQNSNTKDDAWMYTDRPFDPVQAQKMIDDKKRASSANYQ